MLRAEDIAEAVKTGVITTEQAAALEGIATARHKARVFAVGREERFRLMGGFNDFFIAVGVMLLGIAIGSWPIVGLVAMWGLAEYLTGKLKLVAPSILIVAILAISAVATVGRFNLGPSAAFAAAMAVIGVHYWRFRLPFSLFVLALTGVGLILSLVSALATGPLGIAAADVDALMRILALVLGLGVFAWAMSFDMSDPERLTLRADCGFWLHLIAAPLIVHSLAGPLMSHPMWPGMRATGAAEMTGAAVVVVVLLVFALSTIALIVDRRALLVAGLGYLGSALAYTLSKVAGASPSYYVVPVLVFLGVLIIVLGVRWRHIRSVLMSALSGESWKRGLPPYVLSE
ncbi:MAG: hypothetical protein ABL901_17420 [Hyphomicrobiaceae bacterium]